MCLWCGMDSWALWPFFFSLPKGCSCLSLSPPHAPVLPPAPRPQPYPKGTSCLRCQTSLAVYCTSAYYYLCICQSSACPEAEPPVGPQRPQVWPCPRNERLTNPVLSANLGAPALGTPQHQPPSAHPSAHPPRGPSQRPTTRFQPANLPRSLVTYLHIAQPLPFAIAITPASSSLPG